MGNMQKSCCRVDTLFFRFEQKTGCPAIGLDAPTVEAANLRRTCRVQPVDALAGLATGVIALCGAAISETAPSHKSS